jgi:arylsulfatase A-like enzyme/Tfp pilus assembly protein PilF
VSALQPTSFLGTLRRFVGVAGVAAASALGAAACNQPAPSTKPPAPRPSILLITLDTTRADSIGPASVGISTPSFNAVAARGRRFVQAYAAVPETLPSHTSMLSGLYPAAHGVHENARVVSDKTPLVAADLKAAGYRTSAFVSSFVLSRRFGLGRGFDVYDDELPAGQAERSASATADRAIADLNSQSSITNNQSRFIWVHFNDAHAPYAPPEPFRSQFAKNPYLGEIAAMDREIGRLVEAFEGSAAAPGPKAIIIVGDHGEGLGEHGEKEHGHLLYQSTMHVPLVVVGPDVARGDVEMPVSNRRVAFTILDFAGVAGGVGADADIKAHSLRTPSADVVLGEAMKPFLEYGWQPQVMAVAENHKAILSGRVEGYDLAADPRELRDLAAGPDLPTSVRNAVYDYPVPVPGASAEPASMTAADRQKLASLGYVSGGPAPVIRKDAPRAADMLPTLAALVQASTLFSAGRYADAVPVLSKILSVDSHNVAAALQMATAQSMLGRRAEADRAFDRAEAMAPASPDVAFYRALHEGRFAMAAGDTAAATSAFERARSIRGDAFRNDLELGVLYLAARRFTDARAALDRVVPGSPGYAMALFKRAQVSVLLNEPDAAARIEAARRAADAVTRPLIASERLFKGRK